MPCAAPLQPLRPFPGSGRSRRCVLRVERAPTLIATARFRPMPAPHAATIPTGWGWLRTEQRHAPSAGARQNRRSAARDHERVCVPSVLEGWRGGAHLIRALWRVAVAPLIACDEQGKVVPKQLADGA